MKAAMLLLSPKSWQQIYPYQSKSNLNLSFNFL